MRIDVSKRAARYIEQRGGHVYIWAAATGSGMVRLAAAVEPPEDLSFVPLRVGRVQALVETELAASDPQIRLVRTLLPPFGLAVLNADADVTWAAAG